MTDNRMIVSPFPIEDRILLIRGQRVMLDVDIAHLYGVSTGQLNQQVTRNIERFPEDFMFQLSPKEKKEDITNCDILEKVKYSRVLPRAFTEHGAIMIANVLSSKRAAQMSVYVVRAFVRLRDTISKNGELAQKFTDLESRILVHDKAIQSLFAAIRKLMSPASGDHKKIGFDFKK